MKKVAKRKKERLVIPFCVDKSRRPFENALFPKRIVMPEKITIPGQPPS
jgi:hypothetical protein